MTSFGDFPRRFILYMEKLKISQWENYWAHKWGRWGIDLEKISCFLDTHEHTKLQSRIISYHLCHTDFIHPGLKIYHQRGFDSPSHTRQKQWQSTCFFRAAVQCASHSRKRYLVIQLQSASFWSRSLFNLVHSLFTIWLFNIAMV